MKHLLSLLIIISTLLIQGCNKNTMEPDDQFVRLYYQYGKDEINTFNNTLTKDMVVDPNITISFKFTADEQKAIIEKAKETGFFAMPDTFKYVPEREDMGIDINPNFGPQTLRIQYGNLDKRVVLVPPIYGTSVQFKNYGILRGFILDLVFSKPEYKKLPQPRAGYL